MCIFKHSIVCFSEQIWNIGWSVSLYLEILVPVQEKFSCNLNHCVLTLIIKQESVVSISSQGVQYHFGEHSTCYIGTPYKQNM